MKKLYFVIPAALLFFPMNPVSGQSLKDLFNKESVKDIVGTVVESLDIIPENIEGEWSYSGTAVKLTGDNMLTNAASTLVTGQVEDRMNGYLEQIGIREGTFRYVFNADNTFSTYFGKLTFSGTYSFLPDEDSIVLDYGKSGRLGGVTLKAGVTVRPETMELLFNADKILEFIGKISSSTGDSKFGILSSLVNQYDGMKIGFQLTRKAE